MMIQKIAIIYVKICLDLKLDYVSPFLHHFPYVFMVDVLMQIILPTQQHFIAKRLLKSKIPICNSSNIIRIFIDKYALKTNYLDMHK